MTTTFDFGAGPVPAHKHRNGGGWVAEGASVAESVYVGPWARVSGGVIYGDARVSGDARVYGGVISGDARVSGGVIYGDARVSGGEIFGGEISGGEIFGGEIVGGEISGGVIVGGEIVGGEISGGVIFASSDLLHGVAHGFTWTATRNAEYVWTLRFGCERHTLKAWAKLHVKLAKKHNKPHMAKVTRAVCALVKAAMVKKGS